ncbi:hypothetical protein [Photobacterium sp. TLY01]|uniref:hypothetical protein n=1 Tax=Photobacterium sp. TLY01 TaxID=2907534 RepID=UPI001F31447E|nr:hypothetical protein [Photobacterium sp. TLY01]UIP27213.1 hypothetical protein LN341_11280 [Photobacterium sp. TLY01]
MIFSFFRSIRNKKEAYNTIKESGLFDADFYRRKYGIENRIDPINHYLETGVSLRYDPSKYFSTKYYLENNDDVLNSGLNPFYHYIVYGKNEGRVCSRIDEKIEDFSSIYRLPSSAENNCYCKNETLFCSKVYKESYSDLKTVPNEEAYSHFINFGINEGRYRHFSSVFFKYKNKYGYDFLNSLEENESIIGFMRDKAEESDLEYFLNFYFEPCTKEKSLFCFDIFDTLIYREVFNPEDIFSIVELKSKHWGFGAKRIAAETRCKSKFGSKQYLLKDIYAEIEFSEEIAEHLMLLELEEEKNSIKVRQSVFDFLDKLEAYGHEIHLISDFHLTKNELLNILPPIFKDRFSERMTVSGDSSLCKHSSELYDHFFEILDRRNFQNVYMIGDNYYSDYINASKYFDQAIRIPTINETKLRKYIDLVVNSDILIRKEIKRSIIEKNSIIAPILASSMISLTKYLHSIKSLDEGTNIFTLGRDGYLLKRSYNALYDVNIPELSNSRSLNFASIIEDFNDIDECFNRDGFSTTIGRKIKNRLGFSVEGKISQLSDEMIDKNETLKTALYEKIIPYCQEQRGLYQSYLSSHNIVDHNKYIAFDIGYRGTSAKAFTKLLPNADVSWVYFATFSNMVFKHKYDAINENIELEKYGQVIPILEALFSDENIGSAHYFEKSGRLIRKVNKNEERIKGIVNRIQDDVVDFIVEYKEKNGEYLNIEEKSFNNILEYLTIPDFEFCKMFVGVENEDSFANATSYYISPDLDAMKSSWQSGLNSVVESINEKRVNEK